MRKGLNIFVTKLKPTLIKVVKVISIIFLLLIILIIIVSQNSGKSYQGSYTPTGEHCEYGYDNRSNNCCDEDDYYCEMRDNGATAECRDGSYSYSKSRSGTCSNHNGVSAWIY